MTNRRRIWNYLKASREPLGTLDISIALDIPQDKVKQSIFHMRHWCEITVTGKARRTRYAVSPWAEYKCPGSGNSIGSRMARQNWDWRKGLDAIRNKKRPPGVPLPATALEQCWPIYETKPMRRTLDSRVVSHAQSLCEAPKRVPEVRPEFSEAAD